MYVNGLFLAIGQNSEPRRLLIPCRSIMCHSTVDVLQYNVSQKNVSVLVCVSLVINARYMSKSSPYVMTYPSFCGDRYSIIIQVVKRQTDRGTGGRTDRLRQIDRRTDRQTERHIVHAEKSPFKQIFSRQCERIRR